MNHGEMNDEGDSRARDGFSAERTVIVLWDEDLFDFLFGESFSGSFVLQKAHFGFLVLLCFSCI